MTGETVFPPSALFFGLARGSKPSAAPAGRGPAPPATRTSSERPVFIPTSGRNVP